MVAGMVVITSPVTRMPTTYADGPDYWKAV